MSVNREAVENTSTPVNPLARIAQESRNLRNIQTIKTGIETFNVFPLPFLYGILRYPIGADEIALRYATQTIPTMVEQTSDKLFGPFLNASRKKIGEAIEQLKADGIPETPYPAFPENHGASEQHTMEHHIGRRIRGTKLYLARRGKLSQYEPGKWLTTVPRPEGLNPTQAELDEAHDWFKEDRKKSDEFIRNIMQKDEILVECGDERLMESTRVYNFTDPRDANSHKSYPLMNVMTFLGAKRSQTRQIGFKAGMAYLRELAQQNSQQASQPTTLLEQVQLPPYHGIYSPEGRQAIADFFDKPVTFYMNAQIGWRTVDRYGVKERELQMKDGLVEHLFIRQIGGAAAIDRDLDNRIKTVEPTRVHAENSGILIAKA